MTATELVTTRDTSPARRTRRPTYVRSQGRRQIWLAEREIPTADLLFELPQFLLQLRSQIDLVLTKTH